MAADSVAIASMLSDHRVIDADLLRKSGAATNELSEE
jgi:hypothetical protein